LDAAFNDEPIAPFSSAPKEHGRAGVRDAASGWIE
jgi:hypothetical protein